MKDITLFTWTKLGLIPPIQHPISGHHLTLQMPEKFPYNKGQRFVILHAGCKTGFFPGCELVFKTLSTDGRDYHSEMNSVIFNKWKDFFCL
jgi:hypothetical protein